MTGYSGTLRPNYLRQRLSSRPSQGRFAVVCPKCSFKWYFQSDWEALQCCAAHEHFRPAIFVYSFIPTKISATRLTLYEHVWMELVDSGEIHLEAV